MKPLLLSYYGEDFAGSTDVMEALTLTGVHTLLFMEPPSAELLEREFPGVQAVGVAGGVGALAPGERVERLRADFAALGALGARRFHYHTHCVARSRVGMGVVLEVGRAIFGVRAASLAVGAPKLRWYVAFGHLFNKVAGQASVEDSPLGAGERDLRRYLAGQTAVKGGLVDVLALEGGFDCAMGRYAEAIEEGAGYVLFDTINEAHLGMVGRLLWEASAVDGHFMVGNTAVEYALTLHWHKLGLTHYPALETLVPARPFLGVSGSVSKETAEQIAYVEGLDWELIRMDCVKLLDPAQSASEQARLVAQAVGLLREGGSLLLFTARGPDDPAIAEVGAFAEKVGLEQPGRALAMAQAKVLRAIAEQVDLPRICLAGDDTAVHCVRALGIHALEFVIPLAPGAPMCRTHSRDARFHQRDIAIKGGAAGKPDYFECVREGRILV